MNPIHARRIARPVTDATIEALCVTSGNRHSVVPVIAALGARVVEDADGARLDGGADLLRAVVSGARPDMGEGVRRELREASIRMPTGIGAVDLAILAHSGLDVPACILLAVCADLSAPRQAKLVPLFTPSGRLMIRAVRHHDGSRTVCLDATDLTPPDASDDADDDAAASRRVTWSDGSVVVAGLPDTILAQLPGRPLADVVSHPALDPLGLVIASIEIRQGGEVGLVPADAGPRLDAARLERGGGSDWTSAGTIPDPPPIPERDPSDLEW